MPSFRKSLPLWSPQPEPQRRGCSERKLCPSTIPLPWGNACLSVWGYLKIVMRFDESEER
jgi:hypothetical protein